MVIKIVYDNTVYQKGLKSDWGFAAVIEAFDKNILFDSGADGKILLDNMRQMNIDPKSIDTIFLSHHHFDHTGGLASFLGVNSDVKVYAPNSLRGVKNAAKVVRVKDSIQIGKHLFSTGELAGIEQSLIIKTENGLIIIVGCSHSGIENILAAASQFGCPFALIGGFHGFNNFPVLANLQLICPTHCTKHIEELRNIYPSKFTEGGAGRIIEI
ncbi:MAG: MBL fold metallo-hydrolase [Candidatus Marinimicrobia bacterium]|nr:MBL fold metallo-hydrolase [Candidatus Neomarinimicrobiota bacterium]